jgi:acetylornithine deacetylase/succinyl-diaminopimelate desuccinylase-like protein
MNLSDLQAFVDARWRDDIVPRLVEYVRIPAKSPAFDASWAAHGHIDAVIRLAEAWARGLPGNAGGTQALAGMRLEVVHIEGRTPCIFFDVPATQGVGGDRTVLFYGHLDKQPEMTGWREDLGPWKPVIEDGKLYGRGSADDGYAIFAALTAIAALDAQSVARPRCVGLIESCEESGSFDLPAYLDLLAPRMGDVALVVGLDSGCGNYEQLWVTTSLRGLIGGVLSVEILDEGVHSGNASGIVPSSFRIARRLLDRIDDAKTGQVLAPAFHAPIPAERAQQARAAGDILGDVVWQQFPWVSCTHDPARHAGAAMHAMPTTTDPVEAILNRTWRPALSVTGAAGFPTLDSAGNVLRPKTSFKLSMRLPPTVDGEAASRELKSLIEADPPYDARITFKPDWAATGWNAPPTAPWLKSLLDAGSQAAWGREAAWMGEGGTIPFMNMLGEKFPSAQFLITGVLGPKSNAHGPNEFLHIPYATTLTRLVAGVVAGLPRT